MTATVARIATSEVLDTSACAATSPASISSSPLLTPCMRTQRQLKRPTGRRSSPSTTSWLAVAPTPVVALNRAIAIGEVHGAAAALALVDELELGNYHPFHAARADLLHRLGRNSEAKAAYEGAAAIAPTNAEWDFLRLGGRASCRAHRRPRRARASEREEPPRRCSDSEQQ
jgi:hypothetical protein